MKNSIDIVAQVFKALGDPTRLKIIVLLLSSGNNLCVGMIKQRLDISQPAVSQHLKILKNSDLVESKKAGFHTHYMVNEKIFRDYKIDIGELLKAIEIDFGRKENCVHNGGETSCNTV